MAYKVQWHEDIWKDIEKFDKDIARKIIKRMSTYLVHNPIKLGKALTGQFTGLYRDYRILYVVDLGKEIIMVLHNRHIAPE